VSPRLKIENKFFRQNTVNQGVKTEIEPNLAKKGSSGLITNLARGREVRSNLIQRFSNKFPLIEHRPRALSLERCGNFDCLPHVGVCLIPLV